jgi:hypothetical protein
MENVLPVAALLAPLPHIKHFISKVKWINLRFVREREEELSMTDDQ